MRSNVNVNCRTLQISAISKITAACKTNCLLTAYRILLCSAALLLFTLLLPSAIGAHDNHEALFATVRITHANPHTDADTSTRSEEQSASSNGSGARPESSADEMAHALIGELALTTEEHQVGLMDRPLLDIDAGMLFVFERSEQLSFWMKDTIIPLSIAFLDEQATILNIEDMEPFSLESVPSDGKAQYALEVNRGYFAERGIAVGDRVTLTECPNRLALLQHAPQKVVAAVLRLCR